MDKVAASLARAEPSTHTTPKASSESRSQSTLLSFPDAAVDPVQLGLRTSNSPLQSLPLGGVEIEIPTASDAVPVFFEICVNVSRWERRLGEINISQVRNDHQFFQAIKQKYRELRWSKTNYFLEPRDIRYVRVCLFFP